MFEPIYSLTLSRTPDGHFIKSAPLAGTGWSAPIPLEAPYADVFRKTRSPGSRELIQHLVGTAYACAALNADLLAATRLRLYVRTRPGESKVKQHLAPAQVSRKELAHLKQNPATSHYVAGEVSVEEVTQHPLLDLLKRPNPSSDQPGMCGYDLRWMTQMHLESVGRAYWLIERDGLGVPVQLWLLRPHLVREVPDLSGKTLIDHYEYGGARGAKYSPSEIIKFHFPDPANPYLGGYSPLAAAIEKIRISRKEEAHLTAMLDNMGRPDALWSPKGDSEGGGIGAAEAQRVRSAFRQAFAMAGRGGLFVSETPGTLEPLQWSPQDIVEIERAKAIKTDICNVFAVPDAKLERNAANLAAARTADYAHTKDAGLPRCTRNEETLNARLIPMFDTSGRLFLAYDSPVHQDEVFVLEQTRVSSALGAITRNEVRASCGLDPAPWGDQPLVPDNMVEVDAAGRPQRSASVGTPAPKLLEDVMAQQRMLAESHVKLATALENMVQRMEARTNSQGTIPVGSAPRTDNAVPENSLPIAESAALTNEEPTTPEGAD